MTSGAIQKGVPTKVFFFDMVAVSCPETPKSASLTSPFEESRTLAAVEREKEKREGKMVLMSARIERLELDGVERNVNGGKWGYL
jgi:hypothetical protein